MQAGQPVSHAQPATRSRAPRDELGVALEQARGQADPAGHAVVEVDDRAFGVGRADLAHEPKVARVAHEQDAGHGLHRSAGADEREVEVVAPPVGDRRGSSAIQ